MFTVDAAGHAIQCSDYLSIERSEVSRVHQRGFQPSDDPPETVIARPVLSCTLPQFDNFHVADESRAEISRSVDAEDRMPVPVRRHVVDQIDKAVFQSAHGETINHVQDER